MGDKKYALIKKKRQKMQTKEKKKPHKNKKSISKSKNDQSHKKTKLGGKTKIQITKLIRILFPLILPVFLRQAGLAG